MSDNLEKILDLLSKDFGIDYIISNTEQGNSYVLFKNKEGPFYVADKTLFEDDLGFGIVVSNIAFHFNKYNMLGKVIRDYYRSKL